MSANCIYSLYKTIDSGKHCLRLKFNSIPENQAIFEYMYKKLDIGQDYIRFQHSMNMFEKQPS